MRITKLVVENVKRISRVEIDPAADDPLIIVRGNNTNGKSSVLDAIKYAFAGKSSHPPRVIRDGERHACVEVETDEITVTRRWVAGAEATTTELEVRAKDGTKLTSPQKVLDKIYDELAFDALEFVGMKPADQLELLKKLVGLDTTLIDRQIVNDRDARTVVGRMLEAAKGKLAAFPNEPPPAAVDVVGLQKEADRLREVKSRVQTARAEQAAAERRIDDAKAHVAACEAALKAAQAKLDTARQAHAATDNALDEAEEAAAGVDALIAHTGELIQKASAIATARARWEERGRVAADVDARAVEYAAKTARIGELEQQKSASVAAAVFPIAGLAFGPVGVLYNGLPFEQASQAEQLRVSVAVGAARRPRLRVMTVRDGSRLDRNGLKLLSDLAREREIQVWLEAVGEDGPATVVIVDGMVRAA